MDHSGRTAFCIPILAYHLVTDRPDLGFARVSKAQFRRQMQWLADAGFHSIRVRDLLGGASNPSERWMILTFDDAYSCIEDAAEVMQQYGFVGTCFVISNFMGKANSWDYRFGIRNWKHADTALLRHLLQAGWEIGSHTANHSYLPSLDDHALKYELIESKRALQREFQTQVDSISYPFGRTNQRVCKLAHSAGYRIGVSLGLAPKISDACGIMALPRIGVYSFEPLSVFAMKLNRFYRQTHWILAYQRIISFFSNGTIIWKKLGSYGREKNQKTVLFNQ